MNLNNSFSQTSNFKVFLSCFQDVIFNANSINLPSFTLSNIESFVGSGKMHLVGGDSIQYSEVTIGFLLDEKFEIYKKFVNYFNEKVHNNSGILDNESFECGIEITDNIGKPLLCFEMHNCRFTNFSDIQLTINSDDTEIEFSIGFQFDWWELVDYIDKTKIFKRID